VKGFRSNAISVFKTAGLLWLVLSSFSKAETQQNTPPAKFYSSSHLVLGTAGKDLVINGHRWSQNSLVPAWVADKKPEQPIQTRAIQTRGRCSQVARVSRSCQTR
jgi:hypothetical protein